VKPFFLLLLFSFSLLGDDYAQWLKQEQEKFNGFRKNHNEEFAQELKKDWEAFQAQYLSNSYEKPKPIEAPNLEKESKLDVRLIQDSPFVKIQKPLEPIITTPKPKIFVEKKAPQKKLLPIKNSNMRHATFDFYSNKIDINYHQHLGFLLTSVSKEGIGNFWERFIKLDNNALIEQLQNYISLYNLNDWATYLLVHKLGMEIYKTNNMANLFSWYVLTQMNYDVKIGYSHQNIYLLANMKHDLFQVAFLTLQGTKYYVLTPKGQIRNIESIYTYKTNHAKANELLSFEFKSPLLLNNSSTNTALHFKYEEKHYIFEASYSKDLIDFYKTFPQSSYPIYFYANNSSLLFSSLLPQLKTLLENRTEIEAVNMLLRFVQTSFEYKTDEENFGYEKVLFPEETIFYPYSDCEDRAILFTFLVKHLLNLEVIGIKYSDHMATAVRFSSKPALDGFVHKNHFYVIADPTYVNANIGMSIPKYQNKRFDIIE